MYVCSCFCFGMKASQINKAHLQVLQKVKKPVQQVIIRNADRDLIKCFKGACSEILSGKLGLSSPNRAKAVSKYKTQLRKISKGSPAIVKRELQRGGIIPWLIPLISGAVGLLSG